MGQRHIVKRGRRTAACTVLLLAAHVCGFLRAHGADAAAQSSSGPWNAKVRALLALHPELRAPGRRLSWSDIPQEEEGQYNETIVEDAGTPMSRYRHHTTAVDEAAARVVRAAQNLDGTHPVDPAAAAAAVPCKPFGIALASVAVHEDNFRDHLMRWMAVANLNAYSAQHGYKVYVNAAPLHPERNAAWHKFLLAKAAFEHSCPEYVWLLDSDAYIMNITQSIQQALPEVFALPPEERPDVIVSEDCNDLNSGSFLLRNTPWTRQHLSDAWATTQVYMSRDWRDQAALMHLSRLSNVAPHYQFVKQRAINSYPASIGCADDSGPYQEGDMVLHFVSNTKHNVMLDSQWLNQVPIDQVEKSPSPVAYGVWPAATAPPRLKQNKRGANISHVNVTMSSTVDRNETLSELYLVVQEPFDGNPGWPLRIPKLLRSVRTATNRHRHRKHRAILKRE